MPPLLFLHSTPPLTVALLEAGLGKLHPSFDPARVAGGSELAAAQDKAKKQKLKVRRRWNGGGEGKDRAGSAVFFSSLLFSFFFFFPASL
jgi:hypothetical protein